MIDQETIGLLMKGVNAVSWQSLVMIGVSFVLFYLAIVGSYQALSRPTSPPQAKDYLKGIITDYLIRRQVKT